MSKLDSIDAADLAAISKHLLGCRILAEEAAGRLFPFRTKGDSEWVNKQIDYWQHVAKGLKWADSIARTLVKE